jgi:hypothetical protein
MNGKALTLFNELVISGANYNAIIKPL